MKRLALILVCLGALVASISSLAFAQASKPTNTVTIKITDPTGAPIPKAHIRIVPYPLELSRKLETNTEGIIKVELFPGEYEAEVRATAFRSSSRPFTVTDAKNETIAVPLQVGAGSYVEFFTSPYSSEEKRIWELENTLWKYVSSLDVERYGSLWEQNAIAWRDEGYFIIGRKDAVAWLGNYQAGGLELEEYSLVAAEIRASGNAAVAYYNVNTLWLDKLGRGKSKWQRVGHTWVKVGGQWQIMGENIVIK